MYHLMYNQCVPSFAPFHILLRPKRNIYLVFFLPQYFYTTQEPLFLTDQPQYLATSLDPDETALVNHLIRILIRMHIGYSFEGLRQ